MMNDWALPEPYDWKADSKTIKDHGISKEFLDTIRYDEPATWEIKKNGRSNGPPVILPSGDPFYYYDRKRIAKYMLDHSGKKARAEEKGKTITLWVGKHKIWSTTKGWNVAAAALAAFNGGDVKRMLSLELFKAPGSGDLEAQGMPLKGGWKPTRKQLGVEDFKALQEVNDKVGAAGELIAVKEERQRLRVDCGCDEPDKYVKHVALNDVGLGYDIESVYPGTKRYIEVKSSVIDPYEFFISKGEIDTLKEKAEQGWIYFVVVDKDLSGGKLVAMINNPFGIECQSSIELTPVKWKAKILPTAKGY